MRTLCLAASLLLISASAAVAQSFVYVPVLVCTAGPACAPELDVYDAATTALARRISLRPGATLGAVGACRF